MRTKDTDVEPSISSLEKWRDCCLPGKVKGKIALIYSDIVHPVIRLVLVKMQHPLLHLDNLYFPRNRATLWPTLLMFTHTQAHSNQCIHPPQLYDSIKHSPVDSVHHQPKGWQLSGSRVQLLAAFGLCGVSEHRACMSMQMDPWKHFNTLTRICTMLFPCSSQMFLTVHLNHRYTVRSFSVLWNQPELEAKHRFIL